MRRTESGQSRQVRRLGKGVADIEDSGLAAVPRQAPRDLDRTFIAPNRRAQLARSLAGAARPRSEGDRVVEGTYAPELLARDNVPNQRRARECPFLQPRDGVRERVGLRITTQREPVQPSDELLVREGGELEFSREAGIHARRSLNE